MRHLPGAAGFTLLELLCVMAISGVLLTITAWGSGAILRDWQVQRAAQQMLEDLKSAQRHAELRGSSILSDGRLHSRRSFLVFAPSSNSYALYGWQDDNGSGTAEPGESALIWRRDLPPGVSFGWSAAVDRKACSNPSGVPGGAVTFASPTYPPCDDRPCVKFDSHGFSVMGPGSIYLNRAESSYALSMTRTGLPTLCKWRGGRWE